MSDKTNINSDYFRRAKEAIRLLDEERDRRGMRRLRRQGGTPTPPLL